MTQYQFIKTKVEIAKQLHNLWDNYPLYKFINGAQWVRKREIEIAECLVDRDEWIEVCRTVWLQHEQEKSVKQNLKKKP